MTTFGRTAATAAAAVATLVALAACTPAGEAEEQKTTLVLADVVALDNWDPAQSGLGGENFPWNAVFDALTYWDADTATFSPRLAQEIAVSDDRRTMTFQLREDVDFVDGVHMDAAGVEKYYDALLASSGYVFNGTIAGYDTEFAATGEYTLEMTTAKPIYLPDFWILLSNPTPVLSPTAVDDPERALSEPLGSGPYLLEEGTSELEATFVRNPDYWDPERFPFDTVIVKHLIDPVAKLNALKSGQVDAAPLTIEQVAEAEASGLTLNEGGGTYTNLFVRDPENSTLEALRDSRVRQAISMAIDREAIGETIALGYGTATSQAFIPGQPEYIEGGDDRYPYDLAAATDLLAEAGYPEGFDVVIPTYPDAAATQPIVEQSLADIGIRVTFEPFPDRLEWFKAITSGQYPLTLEPLMAGTNGLRYFTEDFAGFGRLMAVIPEIEGLIRTIKEGSAEESAEASQQLGEMVLDEALYIPVFRPAKFWGTTPGVVVDVGQAVGIPQLADFQRAG